MDTIRAIRFGATALAAGLVLAGPGAAETQAEIREQLQAALSRNDAVAALHLVEALETAALEAGDRGGAGAAAYTKGEILSVERRPGDAAAAYGACDSHFGAVDAAAQKLRCRYKAGLAQIDDGQPRTAEATLKSTVKALEALGQERSSFAASVYLTLANHVMPPKLQRLDGAVRGRRAVIEFADKSMAAFEASGEGASAGYASALYLKAEALEAMKSFEASAVAYKRFIELYEALPDHSDTILQNAHVRYNIVKNSSGSGEPDTLLVDDGGGGEVELTLKRTRQVRFPRINEDKLVDGAYVHATITLKEDGRVDAIEIAKSHPDPAFGEAFERAVRHWRFIPPEGVASETLPPFDYGMTFSVHRR